MDEPETTSTGSENTVDLDLLRRASAGDGRSFHNLVDRHANRLYRLACSLVGSSTDAEDVLQEALTGAYKAMGRFEGRSSVKTWLTRILAMQAARWRRDHRKKVMQPLAETGAGIELSEAVGAKIDVTAALRLLSDEHREVLVLREFEQMGYQEMADLLEVPRGTIESRLHRARAELKDKLKVYGFEI